MLIVAGTFTFAPDKLDAVIALQGPLMEEVRAEIERRKIACLGKHQRDDHEGNASCPQRQQPERAGQR